MGDDNRAIEDFNFVLKLEPDNMIALFNRALMLNNTGDYRGAIRDINAVIKEFPNFLAGYQLRAEVRRKMGDARGAELDEFKVLKARWTNVTVERNRRIRSTDSKSERPHDGRL